jgi:hypothetical protein
MQRRQKKIEMFFGLLIKLKILRNSGIDSDFFSSPSPLFWTFGLLFCFFTTTPQLSHTPQSHIELLYRVVLSVQKLG